MLMEGIKIMVLGMSTVFIMLGALVLATAINARVIARFGMPPTPAAWETQPHAETEKRRDDGPIAAAIAAAISLFRRK